MVTRRLVGAAVGLGVDRMIGEPPSSVHPVARFGRTMGAVERVTYAPRRGPGAAYAATGLAIGLLAGMAVRSTALATVGTAHLRQLSCVSLPCDQVLMLLVRPRCERGRSVREGSAEE